MKLNWLKNVGISKIDYVRRPAIDKHFIAVKMIDEENRNKTFIDKIANKIKNRLGLVETKIGRVLNKANETKLLNAAASIVKAGETIQSVLATIGKNLKKEDSDMKEEEIKALIEKVFVEKMATFEKAIEDKLEELLKKDVDDSDDSDDSDDEDNDKDINDDSDDSDDSDDDKDKDKDKEEKKNVSKKKTSKKSKKDKEEDDDLLTKISDIVEKKFKEVKSEVDGIKKEFNIKPKSDKKKVNKKDSDKDTKDNKDEDEDVDYTGVFGIKGI